MRRDRPVVLEIQNVGRSPALDVNLPFLVSAPYMSKENIKTESGYASAHTQQGIGSVIIPGIGPNATIYVQVDSLIGIKVTLKAADFGTYTRVEATKKGRHPLAVISLRDINIPTNW